jgi:chromosome segregation ATPase
MYAENRELKALAQDLEQRYNAARQETKDAYANRTATERALAEAHDKLARATQEVNDLRKRAYEAEAALAEIGRHIPKASGSDPKSVAADIAQLIHDREQDLEFAREQIKQVREMIVPDQDEALVETLTRRLEERNAAASRAETYRTQLEQANTNNAALNVLINDTGSKLEILDRSIENCRVMLSCAMGETLADAIRRVLSHADRR